MTGDSEAIMPETRETSETPDERRERIRQQSRDNLAKARAARGTKPKVAIHETREFQDAVRVAVEAATSEILKKVSVARIEQDTPVPGDEMKWARMMALAIAEVADQGTNRKRVAPEILEARRVARERMVDLIIAHRARGSVPSYQLKNKVYLDEILVEPVWIGADHRHYPTEIDWPGVPNEAMRPMNDAAKEVYQAFSESIGSTAEVISQQIARITPGGLVVQKGIPVSGVGEAPQVGGGSVLGGRTGELNIRGRTRPGEIVETRVLGTIAPAARQNP